MACKACYSAKNSRPPAYRLFFNPPRSFGSRTKDQKGKGLSHPAFSLLFISREFLKVFSNTGNEIFTRERCQEHQQGVVELQFGEGNFVTLHTRLHSRYSRLKLEFFVLRRSLHSGTFWESLFSFCFVLFCFVFLLKRAIRKVAFTGNLGRARLEE